MLNWKVPGSLAVSAILLPIGAAIAALLFAAPLPSLSSLLNDAYLRHVLLFSFGQALLSTLLSVGLAVPIARALQRRQFLAKNLILRLCSMTLVLPVLVAVFGLLTVYGHQGWLATLCHSLGIAYTFSPYGLSGILLAHVFFNLPLASRLLFQSLTAIPSEQRQIADQLAMTGWSLFKYLEWPWLKRQLFPSAALIFMLCFSSFATVLTLGGGPKATTLELAIFQALSFDYDPGRAALLALLQLSFCLVILLVSQWLTPNISHATSYIKGWRPQSRQPATLIIDTTAIVLLCLLLFPPLLAVVVAGINLETWQSLQNPALWQALWLSLRIALSAGGISVGLTLMLLWTAREYRLRQSIRCAMVYEGSAMVILAVPSIVLATGGFLLLNQTLGIPASPAYLVVIVNALLAMPYATKLLDGPLRDMANQYNKLCLSLNLTGWRRFRRVELLALRQPLVHALAFACLLSIGDFGVIALFGSQDFQTLPFYLYQQIGAYRSHQASVTALVLLILFFLLFVVIEKLAARHAHS